MKKRILEKCKSLGIKVSHLSYDYEPSPSGYKGGYSVAVIDEDGDEICFSGSGIEILSELENFALKDSK